MHNITKHQDRRRMVELREETRVQRSLTERRVMSGLQWAGYVEWMVDDILLREQQSYVNRAGDEVGQGDMGGLC